jgi:hypothetical protein
VRDDAARFGDERADERAGHTLLPALGMKARDPAFLEKQRRHLGKLVRR